MVNSTNPAQKYKYNGKELNEELGLDWYDYGARNYDASLGRFMNIDRFAEKYESITPYQYTLNNPIKFVDVNGDYVYVFGDDNTRYKYDNGKYYSYNNDTGEYDTEHKVKKGSFLSKISGLLGQISGGGEVGSGLIDFFSGSKHDLTINNGKDSQDKKFAIGSSVFFDVDTDTPLDTTEGEQSSLFTDLAHEIAHAKSSETKEPTRDLIWYWSFTKEITLDEINASHIENQIRAENNLPLRTHYSRNSNGSPYEPSRLIDRRGNSTHFGSDNILISPLPTVNVEASGGQIFKDRFNYNIRRVIITPAKGTYNKL